MLLLLWIVASPIVSNLIVIPKDNPFFGSYRIVDYVGYSAGAANAIVMLLNPDRFVLLLLLFTSWKERDSAGHQRSKAETWLGIFTIAVFASALCSHNILNALRKATDTYGLCFAAFLIGKTYFCNEKEWKNLVNAMLGFGFLLGCVGYLEYAKYGEWNLAKYGDAHRITGPFRYWETLGMSVSLVAFIAWFKFFTAPGEVSWIKRCVPVVIGILALWCVFRTQTRTIMLALGAGLALTTYLACGEIMSKRLVVALTTVLLVGGLFLVISPEILKNTRFYNETLNRQVTADGRKETYIAAQRMFFQNPIFGIGLKNYQDDMKNYMSRNEAVICSLENTSCHSSYYVIAAELGMLGIIPFALFMWHSVASCHNYFRRSPSTADRAWGFAMIGMSITYFACAITFDPFFDPTVQNWLYCMCLGCTVGRLSVFQYETSVRSPNIQANEERTSKPIPAPSRI